MTTQMTQNNQRRKPQRDENTLQHTKKNQTVAKWQRRDMQWPLRDENTEKKNHNEMKHKETQNNHTDENPPQTKQSTQNMHKEMQKWSQTKTTAKRYKETTKSQEATTKRHSWHSATIQLCCCFFHLVVLSLVWSVGWVPQTLIMHICFFFKWEP